MIWYNNPDAVGEMHRTTVHEHRRLVARRRLLAIVASASEETGAESVDG